MELSHNFKNKILTGMFEFIVGYLKNEMTAMKNMMDIKI
jgi:hypothetical protein